jgi:hypothetical protein
MRLHCRIVNGVIWNTFFCGLAGLLKWRIENRVSAVQFSLLPDCTPELIAATRRMTNPFSG